MMKKLSKIALLAAASAFMLAVFPACGDDDEDDPSVEITGGDSVTIGGTLELTAVVSDFPDVGVAYAWSSSDESVATVVADSETPSKATVTAVAEGKATITVTATVGDTVAIAAIEVSVKAEGNDDSEEGDDPLKKSGTFTEDITALPFSVTTGLTDTAASTSNGKYKITNGTTIANKYFKIVQSDNSSTVYYTDKNRTKINAIELDKQSNDSYIEFTVTGSAEITISAKSTGGSNTSYVEIVAADGTGTFETATTVTGTSTATEIKKTCKAGTYRIVVVTDDSRKSLARIESITAVQTVN